MIKYFFVTTSETNQVTVVSNINTNLVSNIKLIQTPVQNVEKKAQLQTQADSLLKLFDNMPSVPLFTKDEPILKTGTNTERGLAYTICENKNQPTIFIKKAFYEKANQKQLTNILKHELTHAYFCRQGVQADHDPRWRKKFESIGGFGN